MNCRRVSGQNGSFAIDGNVVANLLGWNMGINAPIETEARSNTQGYEVAWVGAKSANGGFSVSGAEPVIKIKDTGLFYGFTGGAGYMGVDYILRALINQVTFKFDWRRRAASTEYGFVSNYQNEGDELKIVSIDPMELKDTSKPKVLLLPTNEGNFYPLVLNDQGLCAQDATLTFSAQANTTSDSCTGGWQTILGVGAVNVTFSATITCANMDMIPEIGTCNRLKLFTDACDRTKHWDLSYFVIGAKDGLQVLTSGSSGVTWSLNMTYSIAPCGCKPTDPTGYIKDPNEVFWVGVA